jgi:hypothetical protein
MNEQEKNEEQTKAQQAAQERAAKEKLERAEESLRQVIELEQQREKRKKGQATTHVVALRIRMPAE